jgi:hypothetical protein
VSWDKPTDKAINGSNFLMEMEEKMERIKQNLKVSQDRKKCYVDKNIVLDILKWGTMFS